MAILTNLLALVANTLPDAHYVTKLVAMQDKDGSFKGAKESITMSGGESLDIETTSLATLAMIKASPNNEYEAQIRKSVDWLNSKRGGFGSWSNTQATILGLKAMTAYSDYAKQMAASGAVTLYINGESHRAPAGTLTWLKRLADRRALAPPLELPPAALDLLHAWYEAGYLVPDAAVEP